MEVSSTKTKDIMASVRAVDGVLSRVRLNLGQLGTIGLFVDDASLGRAEGHLESAVGELNDLLRKLNNLADQNRG